MSKIKLELQKYLKKNVEDNFLDINVEEISPGKYYLTQEKGSFVVEISKNFREQLGDGSGGELNPIYPTKLNGLLVPKFYSSASSSAYCFNLLAPLEENIGEKIDFLDVNGEKLLDVRLEKKLKTLKGTTCANLDFMLEFENTSIYGEVKLQETLSNYKFNLSDSYSKKEKYINKDSFNIFQKFKDEINILYSSDSEGFDGEQMFRHCLGVYNDPKRKQKVKLVNLCYENEGIFEIMNKYKGNAKKFKVISEKYMNEAGVDFTFEYISGEDFVLTLDENNPSVTFYKKRYL